MIDTNYKIEALKYLLDEKCLPERYYPLVQFKNEMISQFQKAGYETKNEIANLSDAELISFGLQDEKNVNLLRRFLTLYDVKSQKFKELENLDLSEKEKLTFRELYYLPGVKRTRATLYFYAGYRSLTSIAAADLKDVLEKTASAISEYELPCIPPLPKEVRTHVAVAKAFTQNG